MPTTTETIARGGEWLLQSGEPDDVFTPERLTDEHRLIARTAEEFVANECGGNRSERGQGQCEETDKDYDGFP